jgi:hypothetical protein
MKNQLAFILSLSILILLCACSSASKLYDKGNYDKAFSKALSGLKKGKKKREDLKILNNSFDKIMTDRIKEIERLKTGDLADQEEAHKLYEKIFDTYDEGKAFLDSDLGNQVDGHFVNRKVLAAHISDTYADTAKRKLQQSIQYSNKLDAQTAYYQFRKAIYYDDKDQYELDSLQAIALEEGTVFYEVLRSSFDFDLGWEIDRVFDDIEDDINDDFVVVQYGDGLQEVDCSIELDFSELNQYDESDVENIDFEERIITGYDTQVDTSGTKIETPIYDEVTGTVRVSRIRRYSELAMIADLRGSSGVCDFDEGRLNAGSYEDQEFYELYGDERAIPDRYKQRNRNDFTNPNNIAEDLIDDLYDDFRRMW